ncbi:hypothetical protein Tco_0741421 [Tanacetum coccineum]
MRIMRDVKIQEEVRREVLSFLEIDRFSWSLKEAKTRTLALNTSTYGTISSESKWKIEWLNSTSWKRIYHLVDNYTTKALPRERFSNFFLPP